MAIPLRAKFLHSSLISVLATIALTLFSGGTFATTLAQTQLNLAEQNKRQQEFQSIFTPQSAKLETPLPLENFTLSDLIHLALNHGPSVKSLQFNSAAAKAAQKSAKWQFYPTIALDAKRVFSASNSPSFQGDKHKIVLSITQSLWTGGKLSAGLNYAKSNTDAASAQADQGKRDIGLQVIQDYGKWLAAALKKDAWQKSLSTHKGLLNLVNRRVNLGLSAKSDRALASGRLASNLAELEAIEAQEQIALIKLSAFIRQPLTSQNLIKVISKSIKVRSSRAELLLKALKLSPDINYARAKIGMASAQTKQQRAAFKPQISLRLEHQTGDFDNADQDAESRIYLQLNSQFGAGLSMLSNIQEAKSLQFAAGAQLEAEKQAIEVQVIIDHIAVRSYTQRIKALDTSLRTAISVAGSYKRQFLAGHKSWLDVLNATRDLVNQRLVLADAKAANLVASWRLATVTNGVGDYSGTEI